MVKNVCIVILLLLLTSYSCDTRYPYDREGFTYKGKLVYNNEFRIDGYYFEKSHNGLGYLTIGITYFFQDGTYCRFSVEYPSDFLNLPAGDFFDIPDKLREIPMCWGFYIVEGNVIKVQAYDPGSRSMYRNFKVEERWATIENDTTIHFFKNIAPNGKERENSIRWYFRSTISKPDSTNILMR